MSNKEIAQQISLLAKLLDIHGESSDLVKNFSNAAFAIERSDFQISSLAVENIAKIRGVGKTIAENVMEFIKTQKIEALESLLQKTPSGIIELMSIKGIGPKKIATIWKELQIETPGELLYACQENRLINYKGFGEKTQQTILEAIEYYLANQGRFLFAQIVSLQNKLEHFLKNIFGASSVFATGAFVRQTEIIDELEYIILAPHEFVFEALTNEELFELKEPESDELHFVFQNQMDVIIHACEIDELSSTYFYTIGSQEFINAFESNFPDLNFDVPFSQLDKSIFEEVRLPFIMPCLRDDVSILQKAKFDKLPELITPKDIKGVIHAHSTWSDGKNSIEEMAQACIQKGYEYLVMSDHSVTSFYANGLSIDRIFRQHEEIDKLNQILFPFKIFKSIECDILNEGQLDYTNDVLQTFDLVITSIHQNLNMTEEKAMMRLLNAIRNPYTRILAHPTGRLLLSRKGYPVNFDSIIDACLKHDVVLEINANPRRLDMDWQHVSKAIDAGVLVSINPDAHFIDGIDDIHFGILAAQKAGLSKKFNLSSFSLHEFEKFLSKKKAIAS